MAEAVVDIAALLAPLTAGEGGAGTDLREEPGGNTPYRRLRDALANARDEERASDVSGEAEAAVPQAWREVKQIGVLCLVERAKDFEVAAWLAEALVRLDGLAGLMAATEVIGGLLDTYWQHAFPPAEGDGLEDRGSALGGLSGEAGDGRLLQPLRRLPLFRRADGRPVGLHVWAAAEDTAAIPAEGDVNEKRRQARYKAGVPKLEELKAEAKLDAATLRHVAVQARDAGRLWAALDAKLEAKFGADSPNTRRVSEVLTRMLEIGQEVLGTIPETAPPPAPFVPVEAADATGAEGAANGAVAEPGDAANGPRPLRTREDAIRQLEELSEWFRRTEPHSPLAYTLDHAVRRARMQLPDLLAEILPDAAARKAMLSLLGIRSEDGT